MKLKNIYENLDSLIGDIPPIGLEQISQNDISTVANDTIKIDWIHPDLLYADATKRGNSTVKTFLYSNKMGLIVKDGNKTHGGMLRNLRNTIHKDQKFNEIIRKYFQIYMDNPNEFRSLIVNGRFAELYSLGPIVNDIIKTYGNEGYLVSVWDKNGQLLDCVNALIDEGYVEEPIYISTPEGLIYNGEITHSNRADPTDVEKIRQIHLMRGEEKKELMDQLGLDPKSKEHEIAAAMKEKGLLKPGQKWWALTSEDVEKGPFIRYVQYNPAVIYIQFPSGDVWEYVLYDNWKLKNLLKSYRRNVGKLVSVLKKWGLGSRCENY